MGFDCPTETCFEEEIFQEECKIYIESSPSCQIPCFLENCTIETTFNVICSVWRCEPKTTTTVGPFTTTSSPITPTPSPHSPSLLPTLITSICFNFISLIIICALSVWAYKKLRTPRSLPVPRQTLGSLGGSVDEIQSLDPAVMRSSDGFVGDSQGSVRLR